MAVSKKPDWVTRGKTIKQLITELQTFKDQEMIVEVSIDGGESTIPISLVRKLRPVCALAVLITTSKRNRRNRWITKGKRKTPVKGGGGLRKRWKDEDGNRKI